MKEPIVKHDPFKMIVDGNPITYERNLIIALSRKHKFFLSLKDSLCPWDELKAIRRQDFSVYHYNILFEVITHFWGFFPANIVCNQPIPKTQLAAHVIDWANNGRIAKDVAQTILEEIELDLYTLELSEAQIEVGIGGHAFDYWMSTRLKARMNEDLRNQTRGAVVTRENVEKILQRYTATPLATNNKVSKPESLIYSKVTLSSKLKCGIKLLNLKLGGGFGRGETVFFAGANGSGKTVMACQLAVDFARQNHNVVYFATEEAPSKLILRMLSNGVGIKYDLLSNRQDLQQAGDSGEEKTLDLVPESIMKDANHGKKIAKFASCINDHLRFLDWTSGTSRVHTDLASDIDFLKNTGFEPQVIIFDWVGGAITEGRAEDLRLLYVGIAKYLVEYGLKNKLVVIVMAQLDKTKALTANRNIMPSAAMISESKTMTDKATAVVGISSWLDKSGDGAFTNAQVLNVEKSRNGVGGVIHVERHFGFQRFVEDGTNKL